MRSIVIWLVVLCFGLSCSPEKTTPQASEALAAALLARLNAEYPEGAGLVSPEESWQQQVERYRRNFHERRLFAGVAKTVPVDGTLRAAMEDFWQPAMLDTALDKLSPIDKLNDEKVRKHIRARIQSWREHLADLLADLNNRLQPRIVKDPKDTAARGVLALGILWAKHDAKYNQAQRYEITLVLNQVLLKGKHQLAEPPRACMYTLAGCIDGNDIGAMNVGPDAGPIYKDVDQIVAQLLNQVHALNPRSSWLALARRFTDPYGVSGNPGFLWTRDLPLLPACGQLPVDDPVWVMVEPTGIKVSSSGAWYAAPALELKNGVIPPKALVDETLPAVEKGLHAAAEHRRRVAIAQRYRSSDSGSTEDLLKQLKEKVEKSKRTVEVTPRGKSGSDREARKRAIKKKFRKMFESGEREQSFSLSRLIGIDAAKPRWRAVQKDEHPAISCPHPEGKSGRMVPTGAAKEHAVLSIHRELPLATIQSVVCTVLRNDYNVHFVVNRTRPDRPWDHPEQCWVPLVCLPGKQPGCEALQKFLHARSGK